jgi:hypothetical protein
VAPSLTEIIVASVVIVVVASWTQTFATPRSSNAPNGEIAAMLVCAVVIRIGLGVLLGRRPDPAIESAAAERVSTDLQSSGRRWLALAGVIALPAAGASLGYTWAAQLWHPALMGHSCPGGPGWSCEFHPLLVSGDVWSVLGGLIGLWFALVVMRAISDRGASGVSAAERVGVFAVTSVVFFWSVFFGGQQGGTMADLIVFAVPVVTAFGLRFILAIVLRREPLGVSQGACRLATAAWAGVLVVMVALAGTLIQTDAATAAQCRQNPVCNAPHLNQWLASLAGSTQTANAYFALRGTFDGFAPYENIHSDWYQYTSGSADVHDPSENSVDEVEPTALVILDGDHVWPASGEPVWLCAGALIVKRQLPHPVFANYPVTRLPGTYYFASSTRHGGCDAANVQPTALRPGSLPTQVMSAGA